MRHSFTVVDEEGTKKEEEKFEFDSAGEVVGYISMEQARVLATRHARENTDFYGRHYTGRGLLWELVSEQEGEDYYFIRLSFRPAGRFRGEPGVEQFTIDKTGAIELREILSEPSPRGRPVLMAAVAGLVIVGILAGVMFGTGIFGGDGQNGGKLVAGLAPSSTLLPLSPEPTPGAESTAPAEIVFTELVPTVAASPTPEVEPTYTPTAEPSSAPESLAAPAITATEVASPTATVVRPGIKDRLLFNGRPITEYIQSQPLFQMKGREGNQECREVGGESWETVFPTYDVSTAEYFLDSFWPETSCLWVTINAAEPFDARGTFPGDFATESGDGTEVAVPMGEIGTLDLRLRKFIRLTSPVDNMDHILSFSGAQPEGRFVRLQNPVTVAWDLLPEAAIYDLNIEVYPVESFGERARFYTTSTQDNKIEVELPPSAEGERYLLSITARNQVNENIGHIWVSLGDSWASGLFFSPNPPKDGLGDSP